jgi:copper(I)-binding protein
MKSIVIAVFCVLAVLGVLYMGGYGSEKLNNAVIEDVGVSKVWARATLIEGRPGVAYLNITNLNEVEITLIGALSEKARRIEIHNHLMEDGVMKMRRVMELTIRPNETIEFKTGSYHLMLFELNGILENGDKFPMVLKFKGLDDKPIEVVVGQENLQ